MCQQIMTRSARIAQKRARSSLAGRLLRAALMQHMATQATQGGGMFASSASSATQGGGMF